MDYIVVKIKQCAFNYHGCSLSGLDDKVSGRIEQSKVDDCLTMIRKEITHYFWHQSLHFSI